MIELAAERIAAEAGAEILRPGRGRPSRARRRSTPARSGRGDLFVGLPGDSVDGGRFAAEALAPGAWGVVVERERAAARLVEPARRRGGSSAATTRSRRLQALARAWRRELGARWSGSPARPARPRSRTSAARSCRGRVHASPENFNTEIGLPLAILGAPRRPRSSCWRWRCAVAARSPSSARSPSPTWPRSPTSARCTSSCSARSRRSPRRRPRSSTGSAPRASRGAPGRRRRARAAPADELEAITFGPGGDVCAISAGRRRRADFGPDRHAAAARVDFDFPFAEAHNLTQRALRDRGRRRARRRARANGDRWLRG